MNRGILILLKAHCASRLRRVASGFSSPRRILLSLFVSVLALVWIGQTLASMLLREPFEVDSFRRWVSLPLMVYFLWHLVRVAWQRPEDAVEWSPEERALIAGGPFSYSEQLIYRFFVILTATLPKAILTTLALWPDLSWFGPLALLLALVFLEIFRMVADLAVSCLTSRGYLAYRAAILVAFAVACGVGYERGKLAIEETGLTESVPIAPNQQAVIVMQSLRNSPFVRMLESPFAAVADVVAGNGAAVVLAAKLAGLCAATVFSAFAVLFLYTAYHRLSERRDRHLWKSGGRLRIPERTNSTSVAALPQSLLARIAGPLVWRQARRAHRYWGSLLVSMGIPGMLACIPLFAVPSGEVAFIAVVSGVLFYTFVLLPEAIKFDFRLDMDHLAKLKMLPMTSVRIVVGQLTTPVVLALTFQSAVIVFAGLYRDVGWKLIVGAVAITSPLTVIFVALDNLVFLLYPHRPTQEGFEAFIRTILKFTGKSLLLVVAGGVLVVWAPTAAAIADQFQTINTATVFYVGLSLGTGLLAFTAVRLVVTAYDRFDVSLDGIG